MSAVPAETQPTAAPDAGPVPVPAAKSPAKPKPTKVKPSATVATADSSKKRLFAPNADFEPTKKTPYALKSITLLSERSQRVFESTSLPMQINFYGLDQTMVLRYASNDRAKKQLLAIEDLLTARFNEIEKEMHAERERLKVLTANVGTQIAKYYTHNEAIEIKVFSPSYGRYIELIQRMDECINYLDGLWMSRVISNAERTASLLRWQNRLIRFHREVLNLKNRLLAYVSKLEQMTDDEIKLDEGLDLSVPSKGRPGSQPKKKKVGKNGKVVRIEGAELNGVKTIAEAAQATETPATALNS